MKRYCVETDWGWVTMTFTEKGLYSVMLPANAPSCDNDLLFPLSAPIPKELTNVSLALELIRLYFHGEPVMFDHLGLDYSGYSGFAQTVFSQLRKVPFGDAISYKELARMVGKENAPRAVGTVLKGNRFLVVVPCHRVIKSNGSLGGFAQGLEWKRKLLFWESLVKETQDAH
ncbi:MAG: methylated-DNA--[protein]-cysteine S-methyltransferase [Coprothermobacterota bacterium]|nr:methylated-DNA--[protein]-cysteine S-methyltransferase [Coprothermobacterota bacterium]